jgi:hypothetical protein
LSSTKAVLAQQGSRTADSQLEVQGIGNVRFDGKTESGQYTGSAHRAVFVQAKDQLYLFGDGRTKAVVKKLPLPLAAQAEPSNTVLMHEGVFNVRNLAMLNSKGFEYHFETPGSINQNPAAGTTAPVQPLRNSPYGAPGATGPTSPGSKPQPNQPGVRPANPADRSINRILQGYNP